MVIVNYKTAQLQAREMVLEYVKAHTDKTDDVQLTIDGVYVVWYAKTLKNWKALLSTDLPDGMYYELTCNGDTGEVYFDAYKKFQNITFWLPPVKDE